MRLSDLMGKRGSSVGPSASRPAEGRPPDRPSPSPEEKAPSPEVPAIPSPYAAPEPQNTDRPTRADLSLYDSLPSAIYKAAAQLEMPVPPDRRLILRNSGESLLKIIETAIKPSEPKEGLWEATLRVVDDLSLLLALNSNLGSVVEHDPAEANRLVGHSINTSLIAMDLSKDVRAVECLPREIGAAGLLHDIGLAALGLDPVDEAAHACAEHVAKGLEILAEMPIPESVRTMVAQHHEKADGKGYPNGIAEGSFLVGSQILAISETFERLMCRSFKESPQPGIPHVNYVQATLAEFHKALDPRVLKAFISLRGFYPDGMMVELTNRSICLVIKQNEGFPLEPVVQVVVDSGGNHPETPRVIDLRGTSSLSIIRAVTYNGDKH